MSLQSLPDEKLISLLREGDQRAFDALFRRYWEKMYAAAFKRLKSGEYAEELVQDLFASLWQKREQLHIHTRLESYLYTSVKYLTIRACRRKDLEKNIIANLKTYRPESGSNIDEYVEVRDFQRQLRKAIRQLPDKSRAVFELSRYKHYSTKEIARTLGVSEKAVEYHMTKALRLLKRELREFLPIILLFFMIS